MLAGPGQKLKLPFVGMRQPVKASLDGRPVELAAIKQGTALRIAWPGAVRACSVEDAAFTAENPEAGWRIAGRCVANVPAGTKATMHVLCDPRENLPGVADCLAHVGGKPVEVRAVRTPPKGEQAHGPHRWTWFEFDVPSGRSEVAITLSCPAKGARFVGEVGWWLWAEHPLLKSTLELEYAEPVPAQRAEPLPLPIDMDREREILDARRPTLFRLGSGR